jgi:DNA-binding CsgD family transcriptional regulator
MVEIAAETYPAPGPRRGPVGPRRLVGRHERPESSAVAATARAVIARAQELLGADPDADADGEDAAHGLDHLERALGAFVDRAVAELQEPAVRRPRLTTLLALVLDLEAVRGEVRERRVTERVESFSRVSESLNRLRAIDDMAALLARAPLALCEACGLERGVLSRVEDSEWTIEGAYFDGDEEWCAEFVRLGRGEGSAQLNHLLLETEMVRRRAPSIVHDAQSNPLAHRPLVLHADVRAYVSAPIMPEGRVIGFVHGDYYYSGHDVDTLDRDAIWAFAQGLGQIVERAALLDRLRAQRQQVRGLLASADTVLTDLSRSEVQFHRGDSGHAEIAHTAATMFGSSESRLEALLTRRQLEILSLMAGGATNAEIASRLVIAEGTVKTHVKHILRKLRAANRAEAVSRYFRLSIASGRPTGS